MVDGATLCNDVDLDDVFPFILFCSTRDSGIHSRFSRQKLFLSTARSQFESSGQVFTDNNCQHLQDWALCTHFRIQIDGKSSAKFGIIHYLTHIQQNWPHEMKCK